MDRRLASMFSNDDPAILDYQRLQANFGGNLVVMMVYDDDELMSEAGSRRSFNWTRRIESIDGVEGVLSVAKLVDVFAYMRPSLPFAADGPPKLFDRDDPVATDFRELFAGYTHSPDETTAAVVAMLDPDRINATLGQLRTVAAEMSASMTENVTLVGEPVLLEDAFDLILADGRRLAIGTTTLLCLVILVSLRDARVVLLSAVSIVWTTLATRAAMVIFSIDLSLVSAILIAIVAVIVVASVMHIGTGVRPGRTRTNLLTTLSVLAIPIAVTCLTDAAGFASLMVSDVRPVGQFGIMTATAAIGVLIALLLFTPAIMSLPDRLGWSRSDTESDPRFAAAIRRIATASLNHRRSLGWCCALTVIVCGAYVSTLKTNTSFLNNFRDDSPIVSAYERVERRLGGASVMDVIVPAPMTISSNYFAAVSDLEERLRNLRVGPNHDVRLTKVLSIADADAVAGRVPLLSFAPPEVRLAGMRSAIPAFAQALLKFPGADDGISTLRSLRIMLRSGEGLSGDDKAALVAGIEKEITTTSFDDLELNQRPILLTGYSVLMSRLVASLVRDQWWALATALACVGALIWFVTGSLSETVAALLVNTLPILFVLSVTGVLGGQLDLGSAMIGAVSIGLSIDGSVHFLAGYHRRLEAGTSSYESAIEAAADLGTPILLASLALVIGFGVLVTSPFVPTATFGLLVSATLAASAIANLTLLPAMVIWLAGTSTIQSSNERYLK